MNTTVSDAVEHAQAELSIEHESVAAEFVEWIGAERVLRADVYTLVRYFERFACDSLA